MVDDWNAFLAPYYQAVSEIKVKLKGIREEYRQQEKHAPIEFITGRVKTVNSIIEKMNVRQIPVDNWIEEVTDIGGIRIMCQFVEDIYETVDLLRQRGDFNIVVERDYITHMKDSGYRSYHIVINYPVERIEGRRGVYIEIQIRTLAMNFWATIEHSLNYKYDGDYPDALRDRLKRAGEAAFSLDKEMSEIREDIQEAQDIFHHYRR
ncbi:MAG TPA: GTP pyrophosphokinase family protein [Bavariicoccus seileri]|uniref:GTP pyrophosphokinase family protein n=1 Tax=Bavariicoccus seileri TaxID=549685 RepID=A0A3D4S3Z6_9ENTE|nr:GTP pyrophosphokinase family protein [Bavariicoccus seileri]HCS93517.1 GTP pyrophosphokinase family protein [Bavariicoccus seileri]